LEDIKKMISDASNVISKYLGVWLYQTIGSRMPHRPCNFAHHKLLLSNICLALFW
jgi:hypothetical protein